MQNLVLTGIDDRLTHGQVMTAWIRSRKVDQVVIVDDGTANDEYMIEALEMAILEETVVGIFIKEEDVQPFEQGLDAPTVLLVKRSEALNYLVSHGITIEEADVGGMDARTDRSVLYKNISTSPKGNKAFSELSEEGVNAFIQVMPQDKLVSAKEYLKQKIESDGRQI